MNQKIRGFTRLSLAPYDQKGKLIIFIGASREDIEKHLTSLLQSELYNTNIRNLSALSETVKYLKSYLDLDETVAIGSQEAGNFNACVDHVYDDCGFYLMFLPAFYQSYLENPQYLTEYTLTVTHEVLHVCQSFLPKFLNRNKELEAEAYFHQMLSKAIMKELIVDDLDVKF